MSTKMDAVQILEEMRALLAEPGRICHTDAFAEDANGHSVDVTSPDAESFCYYGAHDLVVHDRETDDDIIWWDALMRAAKARGYRAFTRYLVDPFTTDELALSLIDDTIAIVKSKSE